jgi:hypothetical protein
MNDLQINDEWIFSRISSQSTSFSSWLKNLLKEVEESLDNVPQDVLDDLKKNKDFESLKDLDKSLAKAQQDIEKAGFLGKKAFNFGMRMLEKVKKPIEIELRESFQDSGLHLDFLTGKRKNLSSALYDVSKERGIESEGLLYLIQALPDLEAFLYSTSVRKYYRDHTEHALRVAVLGDFLLEQDLGNGRLEGIISELTGIEKNSLKERFWWIAGLLHDIGYPLGKMTTAVNYSLVNQLLKCYPTLDLEFTPFEINLTWKGSQEQYLEIIEEGLSKEAKQLVREGAGYYNQGNQIQDLQIFLRKSNGHPEYKFNSPVNLDHGVISALSLLRGLGTPEEIKSNEEFDSYIKIARSIALHNFKANLKDYLFDTQPLAFFLMLIDELQEWGRPISIQVRDTYFTSELKKVSLLDDLLLNLDEFKWMMRFRNQQAKDLMKFDFDFFSREKKKSFGRLNSGNAFPKTKIDLQDIKISKRKSKKKEDIIAHETIII